jgi:predicted permease
VIDAFLQDLRYAFRALRASPGFAAVAILSLALGIGANTAIFSLIDSVILKTLPVSHPEQLVAVKIGENPIFSNSIWEELRDRQDVFSGIFAYGGNRFDLTAGGEARYANGVFVGGQFFDTLGLRATVGSTFNAADDRRGCSGVAVLGNGFWQKEYGGRADAVGKNISLDKNPFEIVGVLPPGFTGVDVGQDQDVYVPLCSEKVIRGENSFLDRRSTWWLRVIGRPRPDVSTKQVEARLKTIAPAVFEATVPPDWKREEQDRHRKSTFATETVANGISDLRHDYQQALMILMSIVGVVLLIACANVANLLLARGAARQREIAIRMALGSGRGRLIRQLLTESLLLSLSGAALGIVFAQWGARLLVSFLSASRGSTFLDLAIDVRMLAFTAGIGIVTGLLFGLAPAWKGTRVNPQSAMKAGARGVIEGSRFGLGKALVVAQVALSLLLVVGAGLMLMTFFKLASLDPGFEREHTLLVNIDLRNGNYPGPRRAEVFREMLEHLRAIPGVRSASSSFLTPLGGWTWDEDLQIEGNASKAQVYFNAVSPGFFGTMGTPMVAGRDFDSHDTLQSTKVAIVNQAVVNKFFAGQNPIGKRYRVEDGDTFGDWVEMVGVVKDAKYGDLREVTRPTAYIAASQEARERTSFYFELRANREAAALTAGAKAAIADVNRDVSLQFKSLAVQVDESLAREKLLATLSGFFGVLALVLAMIGLYGVMSYNVARRRNEIGIRMALGAEQTRVLRMVLGEVAILIGLGLVIGMAAVAGTTRFVATFLYGLKPNDPMTLLVAAGVLAIAAALAGYLPARRAARLDPMTALREE